MVSARFGGGPSSTLIHTNLDQEGWSEPDDAYRDAREILREKPALLPYRAVVVDEAQDLGAEALKLIAAIAPKAGDKPAQDSLFIAGDAHQRIYGRKASMTKCGIDIRGRSRKLKVCYRTSDEIRRWAVGVLQGVTVDDLDDATDDLKGYRSLFHGRAPEIVFEKTSKAEFEALAEWIEVLQGRAHRGIRHMHPRAHEGRTGRDGRRVERPRLRRRGATAEESRRPAQAGRSRVHDAPGQGTGVRGSRTGPRKRGRGPSEVGGSTRSRPGDQALNHRWREVADPCVGHACEEAALRQQQRTPKRAHHALQAGGTSSGRPSNFLI